MLLSLPSSLTIMREDYLTFTCFLITCDYYLFWTNMNGDLWGLELVLEESHKVIVLQACDIGILELILVRGSFLFLLAISQLSFIHTNGWSLGRLFWFVEFSVFGLRRFRFAFFLSSGLSCGLLWLSLRFYQIGDELDHGRHAAT